MTLYGYDADSGRLIAVWHTPDGPRASTIATHLGDEKRMLSLAEKLGWLDEQAWRTFTAPASAAGNADVVNTEAWRRQQNRESFTEALQAVREPNLPTGGMLVRSYIPVLEAAHSVGRVLHSVGDAALTDAIEAEVAIGLEAVEHAELGDLSGRASQATVLSRAAASPLQVEAASAALAEELLGASLSAFEPSAAAVAAANWLRAAAEVAGEVSDTDWTIVVSNSDDIQALPVETPTLVLERLEEGEEAADVVSELICEALSIANGLLSKPGALADELNELGNDALSSPVKLTVLDPQRPALDLLEDLQLGLHGCYLWWSEYAEDSSDWDDAESDDEEGEGLESARRAEFVDLVVARMAANSSN